MFKIFESTAVDSNDDEDGMDYLSESFSSEVDWLFSGKTTNCKKTITGLHSGTKLKALAYAKFRVCPFICPFRRLYTLRLSLAKNSKLLAYSWLLIFRLVLFMLKFTFYGTSHLEQK